MEQYCYSVTVVDGPVTVQKNFDSFGLWLAASRPKYDNFFSFFDGWPQKNFLEFICSWRFCLNIFNGLMSYLMVGLFFKSFFSKIQNMAFFSYTLSATLYQPYFKNWHAINILASLSFI